MILWPGACEVHVLFSVRKLYQLKREHPNALVLAHPECLEEVLAEADFIGSTSTIIQKSQESPADTFIVATESGILHQMQKLRPEARFIQAPSEGSCACNECPYMKLNTLEKIKKSLETMTPQIQLDESLTTRAMLPLQRMMDITHGKSVQWPPTRLNFS